MLEPENQMAFENKYELTIKALDSVSQRVTI